MNTAENGARTGGEGRTCITVKTGWPRRKGRIYSGFSGIAAHFEISPPRGAGTRDAAAAPTAYRSGRFPGKRLSDCVVWEMAPGRAEGCGEYLRTLCDPPGTPGRV